MKAILFDIDGTLTDTKKVDDGCFMSAFEKTFGIDITQQDWAGLKNVTDWGITEEIVQRELGREPTRQEYKAMTSNFVQMLRKERLRDPSQFTEVSGAKAFFDHLQTSFDWPVGIATGSWEESALIKLKAIAIDPDGVAFSNSNHHKSREKILYRTIEQLTGNGRIPLHNIIYFGDGVWDLAVCRKIGIRFIGIDIKGDGKLEQTGAKTVFRNFTQKQKILNELIQV